LTTLLLSNSSIGTTIWLLPMHCMNLVRVRLCREKQRLLWYTDQYLVAWHGAAAQLSDRL
jgi:hypothetical protein